jgi:hypothetical protein
MTVPRNISASHVCAYVWSLVNEEMRAALCALAGLSDVAALLDWYELGSVEQAALRAELADLIEASASRQRAEWCKQAERMKGQAA